MPKIILLFALAGIVLFISVLLLAYVESEHEEKRYEEYDDEERR